MLEFGMDPEGMQLVQMTVILKLHGHQLLWPHPHAAVLPIETHRHMPCMMQPAGHACNADMLLKRHTLSALPAQKRTATCPAICNQQVMHAMQTCP